MKTCQHLQEIEKAILKDGVDVEIEGDWWHSGNNRNIYFKCVLNQNMINDRFSLPPSVEWHEYDGRAAGHEEGLHCKECNSLLVGGHHIYGGAKWPK